MPDCLEGTGLFGMAPGRTAMPLWKPRSQNAMESQQIVSFGSNEFETEILATGYVLPFAVSAISRWDVAIPRAALNLSPDP
jgi:hypothetical protein